jgi:hypothetical protein
VYAIDDNYLDFMNAVVMRRLRDEASNNELVAHGVDGSTWPECEPKNIALALNTKVRFGFLAAKTMIFSEYKDYIGVIRNHTFNLPYEVKKIVARQEECHKRYWAIVFKYRLEQEPECLDKLINEYKKAQATPTKVLNIKNNVLNLVSQNEQMIKNGTAIVKIPGFELVSQMIQGFNPKSITMITAMSGVGKTNYCVSLAQQASEIMDVLFINMEMDEFNFGSRFIHNGASINNQDWRSGQYATEYNLKSIQEYDSKVKSKFNLEYTNGEALTQSQIESEVYRRFDGIKRGLVIIDYAEKAILPRKKDEWAELLDFYVCMEELSKRTNTHIIVISQGDENGDSKASKRAKQPCSSVLTFVKEPSTLNTNLDKYFIKPLKVRYGEFKTVELNTNLAQSKVSEIGYHNAPPTIEKKRGRHEF